MFTQLLFALTLVIIISLVYWFFFCDTALRKSASSLLQKSSGGFDNNAKQALAKIKCIRNPVAADYFEHGRILQYNVLYDDNIPNGVITEQDRINDHIASLYIAALNNLTPNNAGNDFIIRQIHEFNRYKSNMTLQPNQATPFTTLYTTPYTTLLATPYTTQYTTPLATLLATPYTTQYTTPLATLLATALLAGESIEQKAVADRIIAAKLATTTRANAIEKYFDDSTVYTSNAQNVHESQVNSDLMRIFNKMDKQANIRDSFDSARKFISLHPNANTGNAYIALDKMQSGASISTFDTTEDILFASIWSRCDHPKNSNNRANMQAAVVDALADCVENNTLVCTNGRSSRILNSLATLDYDHDIAMGGAMTYEAYRNQIYHETKEIIDQEIDRALDSSDPVLQKVGKSYESGTEICEYPDAYSDYKKGIQLAVDSNINTYIGRMTVDDLNKIRYTCHAYAAI